MTGKVTVIFPGSRGFPGAVGILNYVGKNEIFCEPRIFNTYRMNDGLTPSRYRLHLLGNVLKGFHKKKTITLTCV